MNTNNSYKIQIIDDREITRVPIVTALIKNEFGVISANDGVDGLAMALRDKPDLILLDITMPNMNGIEMMKKLRESGDYGKKVKIIILTSTPIDDETINTIAKSEPSFYLEKNKNSVLDIIQKIKESLGIASPQDNINI